MIQTTTLDLFAGIPVTNYAAALAWYKQLLGFPACILPQRHRGRLDAGGASLPVH